MNFYRISDWSDKHDIYWEEQTRFGNWDVVEGEHDLTNDTFCRMNDVKESLTKASEVIEAYKVLLAEICRGEGMTCSCVECPHNTICKRSDHA